MSDDEFESLKADIKANGNTVPEEKFKGKTWEHADDLKVGDKTCPVTKNKAETECAWVVQGQTYEFCCPPCLDKFIGWAHHQPEKINGAHIPPDTAVDAHCEEGHQLDADDPRQKHGVLLDIMPLQAALESDQVLCQQPETNQREV